MQQANQDAIKSVNSTVVTINIRFLQACLFGWLAYGCWPTRPFELGWGLLAFIAIVISVACLVHAIKDMTKLYQREKTIGEYLKQGTKPKSSTLASDEALKKAGMQQ